MADAATRKEFIGQVMRDYSDLSFKHLTSFTGLVLKLYPEGKKKKRLNVEKIEKCKGGYYR